MAVCGMRGNFDDAQTAVKRIFADRELAELLSAQGSCSPAPIPSTSAALCPRSLSYFAAYAQLLRSGDISCGDEVEFCVPTGNFGDILAGYYAKRLGLPVASHRGERREQRAVRLSHHGYVRPQAPFFTTTSPSMDILVSSNLERMLYYLSDGDVELVSRLMDQLADGVPTPFPTSCSPRSRRCSPAAGPMRMRLPAPSRPVGMKTVI